MHHLCIFIHIFIDKEYYKCCVPGVGPIFIIFPSLNDNQPDSMIGISQTETFITHFNTNTNFLLAPWKDIAELNPKQHCSF